MASKLDRERILARTGINLVLTRVSGFFRASTSFAYPERFSAPLGARKCLSPANDVTPTSEAGRLMTVLMILTGIALIPWQLGDLIKQLLKTANQVEKACSGCSLPFHDADAQFCKICGSKLNKV